MTASGSLPTRMVPPIDPVVVWIFSTESTRPHDPPPLLTGIHPDLPEPRSMTMSTLPQMILRDFWHDLRGSNHQAPYIIFKISL